MLLFRRIIMLVLLFFAFLLAGIFAWSLHMDSAPLWVEKYDGERVTIKGTIIDEPLMYEEETRCCLKVEEVLIEESWFSGEGGVVEMRLDAPDSEEDLFQYGERVLAEGQVFFPSGSRNPGGFDYREFLTSRGMHALFFVRPDNIETAGLGEVNYVQSLLFNLRGHFVEEIQRVLPFEEASLLSGILFGQRQHLPEEVASSFRQAGVSHLLAVSGLHVGLVAAFVLGLLALLKVDPPYNYYLALTFMVVYAAITGMRPPTLRATVMGGSLLLGKAIHRRTDWITLLAAAALITLLYRPLLLFSPGFQFSYMATISIVFLSPTLEKWIPLDFGRLKQIVAVTTAAQLGVLPLTAFYFQQVSLVALLTNVLILPLISLVLALGIAGSAAGFFVPILGEIIYLTSFPLLKVMLLVTETLGNMPLAYFPVSPPSLEAILLFYAFLFAAGGGYTHLVSWSKNISMEKKSRLFKGSIWAASLMAIYFVWVSVFFPPDGELKVVFLDVGQGDAIYIKTPCSQNVLIDGGGRPEYLGDIDEVGERVIIPFLQHKGIKELDLVMISHPHEDHFGGLIPVVEQFPVKRVVTNFDKGDSEAYRNLLGLIREKGIEHRVAEEGDQFIFPSPVDGIILNPPEELFEGTESDINNNSLVFRLTYEEHSFLFTGDIEEEAVEYLVENAPHKLDNDVLKVPHHGGYLEALPEFLDHMDPAAAVITVGANPFGHPHPQVVNELDEHDFSVFRTDRHGAVTVTTNGREMEVEKMIVDSSL